MKDFDLSTWSGRLRAYLDFLWSDHAYLRLGFQNAHWVGEALIRSNQPWPFQLRQWKKHYGMKTVINLRGGGYPTSFYLLEKAACAELGLNLIDFPVGSREVPSAAQILAAKSLFETLEYPALMHCKSGADRAGLMSVLYAHFHLGKTLKEALEQLSLRYLHVKFGNTGVLDYVFERYFLEAEPKGLSFLEWVQTPDYNPSELKKTFRANPWGHFLTEKILRRE